ncbi:MAG: cytoskeleton protein RodZ [Massilia sp.]|jgi:cytoskeleton protein RodZ
MTSERADQSATPDNHARHPGAALATQREAMGWTVEQVAEQLKLAVRQVVAIEKGDYAALPSPAVTRGFVRAYAKILRLDPAPLVAMIPMDSPVPAEAAGTPVRRDRRASFSHSRYPTHGKRSSVPLAWIAGAAVLLAAGAAVWHFGLVSLPGSGTPGNGDALNAPVEITVPGNSGQMPDAVHNPSVPLISVPAPGGDAGTAAGTTGAAGATAPAAVPPGASATPAGAAQVTTTAPATAATTVATPAAPAPAGANTLVLTVREDSWIEVRPQGGKALISRLVRAGSTETVEIPGAATLVVGNPGGVSATLRGAAVALPPVPGKTIARVALK